MKTAKPYHPLERTATLNSINLALVPLLRTVYMRDFLLASDYGEALTMAAKTMQLMHGTCCIQLREYTPRRAAFSRPTACLPCSAANIYECGSGFPRGSDGPRLSVNARTAAKPSMCRVEVCFWPVMKHTVLDTRCG